MNGDIFWPVFFAILAAAAVMLWIWRLYTLCQQWLDAKTSARFHAEMQLRMAEIKERNKKEAQNI